MSSQTPTSASTPTSTPRTYIRLASRCASNATSTCMHLFNLKSNQGDAKWRGTIERALASWDAMIEWGDYIVFLARLSKAIKSKGGSTSSEMPLYWQVSEALARCLDPGLPAGVHQTTIQVYDEVFQSISGDQLNKQINVWLPGLLPVVSYAAFNVKPQVIHLLETHVLEVSSLRELCRPLLLATLPSIEDPAGECYTEIMELTQKLRNKLGDDALMWQCIAMCVITSPESRLGALNYFGQYLPNLETVDDESRPVISPEPGIFLRSIRSGLTDPNIFVQRGFLDILVKSLPAHSKVLRECAKQDVSDLLYSACSTILRKDMSLNRRLWAWLLGPDPEMTETKMSRVDYFKTNCAEPLKKVLLANISTSLEQVCLVVHGLMDRWELATVIVPSLLIPILEQAKEAPENLHAASQLFDGVESNLIWKCMLELIEDSQYDLVEYIVDNYNIKEEEMVTVHIPLALLVCIERKAPESLCSKFLKLIPTSTFSSLSTFENDKRDIIGTVNQFYSRGGDNDGKEGPEHDDEEGRASPFTCAELTQILAAQLLNYNPKLFTQFVEQLPSFSARIPQLIEKMLTGHPDGELFACVSSTMKYNEKSQWVRNAVKYYFESLATDQSRQVESVRNLWLCHEHAGGVLVPSALSQCFAECESPLEVGRVYSALWIHSIDHSHYDELLSKPTMLFLDLLAVDNTQDVGILFIKSAVISTNSSDKLLKVLFSGIKTGDSVRLEYYLSTLKRLIFGQSELKPIKKVFLSQFFKQFLEFFSGMPYNSNNDGCYAAGISIIQRSLLDVDKLNVQAVISVLETLIMESNQSNTTLLAFINTVLPHLPFESRVTFGDQDTLEYQLFNVLNKSIETVETEPQVSAMSAYLETFLQVFKESVPQIVYPITTSLVNRLNELEGDLDKESELVMQILACLDRLLYTNFQYLYDAKGGHFSSYQDVANSPDASASKLLGNVISGVFSVESPSDRSAIQNGRVLLYEAIEMTMRKCCSYWETLERIRNNTNTYSTLLYTMGRLKTRLRKLTAMLYKYQPIETIKLCATYSTSIKSAVKFVHMFEGSRYKNTCQVLFDNILSPQSSSSSYTSATPGGNLFHFLKQYIRSLESDVFEDIWNLSMSFFGDIVTKHAQYERILIDTLELMIIISKKLEMSTFGQNKRLRKDFNEQFIKLFGYALDQGNLEPFLEISTNLGFIKDSDRQTTLLSKVSSACCDLFKGDKSWENTPVIASQLLAVVVQSSGSPRAWKPNFTDLFFDSRFFTLSIEHAKPLQPVIERWVQLDKERVSEFLSRVATYGTNSVLFGWSSSSALVDDNLKRLAFMALSCEQQQLSISTTKLINQLTTIWNNKQSIPCICTLLRALCLKYPQSQVYSFIGFKLQALLCDLQSGLKEELDAMQTKIIVEGAKLLDFVLTLESDQFQMYEWLFICDSTDAIYPRETPQERAGDLLDKLASEREIQRLATTQITFEKSAVRRPLMPLNATLSDVTAFFSQASITLYEEMYSLARVDTELLKDIVLEDLFA